MKKLLFWTVICLMLPLFISANDNYPITIPSVREWIASDGEFNFDKNNRIVISEENYDELLADAKTFNEDVHYLFDFELDIISSNSPQKGDLFFSLNGNYLQLGEEGSEIEISDYITLTAATAKGSFYATRTLLQLFRQNSTVQAGKIVDYPDKKERAYQVDNGRQFFSIPWLENHIRELSYIKMNYFYFYLGDNNDFRIECETNPEIVSEEHYTKQEIRDLISLAKKYHIIIVPVINFPAHCGALLTNQREVMCLRNKDDKLLYSHIDITLDTARNYISRIIDEYIHLFDSPYWHIAADEYVYYDLENFPQFIEYAKKNFGEDAHALDAFIDFVNWANRVVRSYGKTLRIYNDVISVVSSNNIKTKLKVDKNIIIDYWEGAGADVPATLIDEEYDICNCAINFLYYNTGNGWRGYNEFIYERFKHNVYNENREVPFDSEHNLGARFHIWCDVPDKETEGHIANETKNTLRVLSDRLWGGPKLVSTFEEFAKICDRLGLAPYVEYPENPMPKNLCWKKTITSSSTNINSGYSASHINDGSYNKAWKSISNSNEWVEVDLEKIYELERIRLVFLRDYPIKYKLLVSVDSNTWEEIEIIKPSDTRVIDIKDLKVLAKYIKVELLEKENEFTLWELESYGKEYANDDKDTDIEDEDKDNNDDGDDTSVISRGESYKIKIAPNPAKNYVDIHILDKAQHKIEYKIVDIYGKIVDSNENDGKTINLIKRINIERLAIGTYTVIIKIDNEWIYKNLVIMK